MFSRINDLTDEAREDLIRVIVSGVIWINFFFFFVLRYGLMVNVIGNYLVWVGVLLMGAFFSSMAQFYLLKPRGLRRDSDTFFLIFSIAGFIVLVMFITEGNGGS